MLQKDNSPDFLRVLGERLRSNKKNCWNIKQDEIIEGRIDSIQVELAEYLVKGAYEISITKDLLKIKTNSFEGMIYAAHTLIELISDDLFIQLGEIKDQPLVQHRGIMIDTARHFISP